MESSVHCQKETVKIEGEGKPGICQVDRPVPPPPTPPEAIPAEHKDRNIYFPSAAHPCIPTATFETKNAKVVHLRYLLENST